MDALPGAIDRLPDRPGSLNQLKKLGDAIRDDDAAAYRGLHYNEVWSWSNDLVAATVQDIGDLELGSVLDQPGTVSITGRAKIRATVREKLQRRRSDRLPSIQDLAGVRVEADMTLTEQDRMVDAIRRRFGQGVDAVHDLRDGAHAGYRAVHLWVRLDSPRGAWFEVQVRTRLQGDWANMYEALGDVLGRAIRYGELPPGESERTLVETVQRFSRLRIWSLETVGNCVNELARGERVDQALLAEALVGIGRAPEVAEREAARALLSGEFQDVVFNADIVEQVSVALTELEQDIRSLSQGKGE